jgi:hypothetical protein
MKPAMTAKARCTSRVLWGLAVLGILASAISGYAQDVPILPYLSNGYRYLVVSQGGGPAGGKEDRPEGTAQYGTERLLTLRYQRFILAATGHVLWCRPAVPSGAPVAGEAIGAKASAHEGECNENL